MADEPTSRPLPGALDDAIDALLEGDEAKLADGLRELLRANPDYAAQIARSLTKAGVTVPEDALPADRPEFPKPLGQYLLTAKIGSGGFGTVYRAEQHGALRRAVAVKVLNPGMASGEILARFSAEKEALKRTDHPGIARLLDAGETPEGRPYFAMELVEGPTLLRWCRDRMLPLRERIELFLMVLDAVQHAHQKAVVHRDLSANNVLVATPDGRAQPKIIDFGIAKSLADPFFAGNAVTLSGTLMGTREYMSPEQAAGRTGEIDTRTDVYSLGVQLYELLCDRLPIPGELLRSAAPQRLGEVIDSYVVRPPSTIVGGAKARALRGDLDAIVAKALAKDPNDRYPAVAAMAADLRRHLAHEPVEAAPPSRAARLRKFVRRNRALSAAIAVTATTLLVATIGLAAALRITNDALGKVEEQQQELGKKADAGFRLLANEERLRDANNAAALLPPPWPMHRDAYVEWERRHAQPLVAELQKTRDSRRLVEARRPADGRPFVDPADAHLATALLRLERALETFFAEGAAARIRTLRSRQDAIADSAARHAAAWDATVAAVKTSDGKVSSRAYAGLTLKPQPGLVPLGIDPRTRLAEFLDLATHPEVADLPERSADGSLRLADDHGVVFVLVPPGTVRLGAHRNEPGLPQNDPWAAEDELRGETVRLDAFLIAKTELTVAQWRRLRGETFDGGAPDLPARAMPWTEAVDALQRFGMLLPTEARWEYACRAGSTTPWSWGESPDAAPEFVAAGAMPERTGRRRPNEFGLHDMHGNVAEWCADAKRPYGEGRPAFVDGRRPDPATVEERVVRGGAAGDPVESLRSSTRRGLPPDRSDATVGVRPARTLR
ncbi:MAG: hypothetical protein RL398_2162 [Planctomycetota bacterium]